MARQQRDLKRERMWRRQIAEQRDEGAKVRKSYHAPATPCERLLAHESISAAAKEVLRAPLASLDPLALLHGIRKGQAALAALQSVSGSAQNQPVMGAWIPATLRSSSSCP
jgi:hypothetical protein